MTQTKLSTATQQESDGAGKPMLEVRDLKVYFPVIKGLILQQRVGSIKAVDDVSFNIMPGETLAMVGESGSGKSTTARTILQLIRPTSGEVIVDGQDLSKLQGAKLRQMRRRLGIVFQDPVGSLNPRMSAGNIVGEPIKIHRLHQDSQDYRDKVASLLETVGLNAGMASRFPHEFSGGQRQRLGVARALAARPGLIVLDEPVSALDVSIQAQIINLLQDLQQELNLAYLFIAHDLSVVRHIAHRVAVMYLGKIVEITTKEELYANPTHPYTKALLSAVPVADPILDRERQRIVLVGDIPSPMNPPSGCVFSTRCPIAIDACSSYVPELREISPGHGTACIRAPGYGDY
jgi:oligopeptide transport system ATP-binding protein